MHRPVRSLAVPLALSAAGAAVAGACRSLQAQSVVTAANGTVEPRARAALRPADSVRVLRGARREQEKFERLRLYNLPWTHDRGGVTCDEYVGRFCIWHTDEDDAWVPPPEKAKVRAGRATLVGKLDAAAAALPGDDWIAGQRVRYLLEAGRHDAARAAAVECAGARWWCAALAGLTRHTVGEYDAADSAFAEALRTMPDAERRAWTDLTKLLPPDDRGAYRASQGPQRDSLEARFWWLADPLWGSAWNDRRTEHYARHVMDQLQDRARTTDGMRWGGDMAELLLRYGWSAGMQRIPSRPHELGPPRVVSHFARHGREFLPPLRFLSNPAGIEPEAWDISPDRPQTEYAPAYATFGTRELAHQLAVFRRGDSVVLVAGYELSPDTAAGIPPDAPVSAALVAASDERTTPAIARLTTAGRTGALALTTAARPVIVSIEVVAETKPTRPRPPAGRSSPEQTPPAQRRAERARYGLALAADSGAGATASDILLLTGGDRLPRALDEAVPLARGSTAVRSGERVGLYWEVYGLAADTIDVGLTLVPPKAGWMRRAAERLSLKNPATPVRLEWREALAGGSVLRRAIALEVPPLPPGRYTLRVTATPPSGVAVVTERVIEVRRAAR